MLERSVGMDTSYAPAWEALGTRYYYDTTSYDLFNWWGRNGPALQHGA
jgi:hypothetical protein